MEIFDLHLLVGFMTTMLGNVKRIALKLFGSLFALFAISFMVFKVLSRYSKGPTIAPSQYHVFLSFGIIYDY